MSDIKDKKQSFILIISGPTASGKTSLSLKLAELFDGEIINADMGQFYKPFSIGTAKPDFQKEKIPHHLFDIVDQPKNFTVCDYRNLVINKVDEVLSRNRLPIIVGGSLFYLKSLFFPPVNLKLLANNDEEEKQLEAIFFDESLSQWEKLQKIDSQRAAKLHPNDLYRINRALNIWFETKIKPSDLLPQFSFYFNFYFIFLNPLSSILVKNINQRTIEMIEGNIDGKNWIDEARGALGTSWEKFLEEKKIIGYPEILDWIRQGEKKETLNELITKIQISTKQYAKRQITFWKTFKKELLENCLKSSIDCEIDEFTAWGDKENLKFISHKIMKFK